MPRMNASIVLGAVFLLASSLVSAFEDVDADYAYDCAVEDPNCYILDVRTNGEWRWVGHPGINKQSEGADLEGKVVNISWLIIKKNQMVANRKFLRKVNAQFRDVKHEVELITMCRSGSRSRAAAEALEAAGYHVNNMINGFEGDRDEDGYRTKNGWKVEGYPYNDSPVGGYYRYYGYYGYYR